MSEEVRLKPKSTFEMVIRATADTEYLAESIERFRKNVDKGEVVVVTISFKKE